MCFARFRGKNTCFLSDRMFVVSLRSLPPDGLGGKARLPCFAPLDRRASRNAGCGCPWCEIKEKASAAGRRRGTFAPRASAPGARTINKKGASRRPLRQTASGRSEEHTSELQSLIRNPYAVFCLKKKKNGTTTTEKIQRRTSTSTDINRNDSNKLQIEKHTYRITSHNLLNNTAHSNQ